MPHAISDSQLVSAVILVGILAIAGARARLVRVQSALGLEQLLASSFLFLPVGMVLSEAGLGLIDRQVIRELDALVTLGLGVLGLLVGLGVEPQRPDATLSAVRRASGIETLLTIALVGLPTFLLLEVAGPQPLALRAAAAALLGCSAAISGSQSLVAAVTRAESQRGPAVKRVAESGTVVAMLCAGVLLALLPAPDDLGRLDRLLALGAIGAVGGMSAWLLASDTRDDSLRTALLVGVLLVTAGTATHLGLPPVVATMLAGMTIAQLSAPLARGLRSSLAFLEGPLTVLLLVIAGAALRVPSTSSLLILPVFLALRTAAKILGGRLGARASGGLLPRRTGLGLLPSSSLAVGLALDYHAATRGVLTDVVLTVAVLGSLLSETAGVWTTRLLATALASEEAESAPPPVREQP